MEECDQVQQLIEEGLAIAECHPSRGARCFAKDATKLITELESDRRRLEWLVINNARVWLQDGWYDIHDSGGTCIVHMVDDWRDAIDKAMQEGES
jgi:hypothetical protein